MSDYFIARPLFNPSRDTLIERHLPDADAHDAKLMYLIGDTLAPGDRLFVLGGFMDRHDTDRDNERFRFITDWFHSCNIRLILITGAADPVDPSHGSRAMRFWRSYADAFDYIGDDMTLNIGGRTCRLTAGDDSDILDISTETTDIIITGDPHPWRNPDMPDPGLDHTFTGEGNLAVNVNIFDPVSSTFLAPIKKNDLDPMIRAL